MERDFTDFGGTKIFFPEKVSGQTLQAKSICWCGTNVCVGYKREYSLVNVFSGSIVDLFNTGIAANPVMYRIGTSDEILLGRDSEILSLIFSCVSSPTIDYAVIPFSDICVFENFEGKPTRKYGLSWSEPPLQLGTAVCW